MLKIKDLATNTVFSIFGNGTCIMETCADSCDPSGVPSESLTQNPLAPFRQQLQAQMQQALSK